MDKITNPLEFLRWFRPEGPWLLVRIHPETQKTVGRLFAADEHKAMADWIARWDKRENLYFTVNPVRSEYTADKKCKKKDIAALAWLHVDVDPNPGRDLETERARIWKLIEGFRGPAPSLIIDSGGGYQLFWRLDKPEPVSEVWPVERLEAYNRHLEDLLAGDACHNIDRVMRLPFTTNLPNKKKLAAGRVPVTATLVESRDQTYPIGDFDAAPAPKEGHTSRSGRTAAPKTGGPKVELSERLRKVDPDKLPIAAKWKALIKSGDASGYGDASGDDRDRSRLALAIAGRMVRGKCDDATIASILVDPTLGISESYLEKNEAERRRAVMRTIEKARERPTEASVRKFIETEDASEPGKYASTVVAECIWAGLSIVKVGPLFKIAAQCDGVNLTELKSLWRQRTKGDGSPPTQSETLLNILNEAELWHDQDGVGFASFERDDHRETVQLKSKRFKEWLHWRFHAETGGTPGEEVVRSVISNAKARAFYAGTEHRSWIRVAEHDGRLYLDLGDESWTTIEIDKTGWRVAKDPPVRFRRGGGHPLPMPVTGGKIDDLWKFVNVTNEGDRMVVLAWLVATFRPDRPFPILDLAGTPGTAKTTAMRILRRLIDPCSADGRGLPKHEDDLMVSAVNGWLISGDNVSGFDRDMANALCRLATGGGIGKRELFTDGEEFTLDALRPIIMTGLSLVSEQQDLLDRLILVPLHAMPAKDMKQESIVLEQFEKARPRLLGALLDAVSTAIRRLPGIKLEEAPRMADFAAWGEAGGEAFGWADGAFNTAYSEACKDLFKNAAETDLLTKTIVGYLRKKGNDVLQGSATEILETLNTYLGDDGRRRRDKKWPTNASWMSRRLGGISKGLDAAGISFDVSKDPDSRLNIYELRLETGDEEPQLPLKEPTEQPTPGDGDEDIEIPF